MTARTGMTTLISRWRRLVDDAGTAVWTDDNAQQMLDGFRVDVWSEVLTYIPQYVNATTVYKLYASKYNNLEAVASGTTVFRVFDANGLLQGTADWSADYQRGLVTFTTDQAGSARYLDARAYNLNAAAAQGWRERAALTSGYYAFETDGQVFNREQYFEHRQEMAVHFDALAGYGADSAGGGGNVTYLDRTDIDGMWPK